MTPDTADTPQITVAVADNQPRGMVTDPAAAGWPVCRRVHRTEAVSLARAGRHLGGTPEVRRPSMLSDGSAGSLQLRQQ